MLSCMALSAEQIQTQLDALDLALGSGQARMTLDGKTIEYRSVAEAIKARAHLARLLEAASTSRVSPRYRRAVFADD